MKSLEFINKDLQDFEKALENYKKRKTINNEEVDEEYIKQMTKEIENYKQIKQDLEVLEILRKHLYIHTSYGDSDYGEYEDKSICINEIHECFCKEHFNKLKQWLEVNENE